MPVDPDAWDLGEVFDQKESKSIVRARFGSSDFEKKRLEKKHEDCHGRPMRP